MIVMATAADDAAAADEGVVLEAERRKWAPPTEGRGCPAPTEAVTVAAAADAAVDEEGAAGLTAAAT